MSLAAKLPSGKVTSKFAQLSAVRLHYLQQGDYGDPVLFLHGFPEYSGAWLPYLQDLSSGYCTVAPDLRGYHLSDQPAAIADYRIEFLIRDLIELMDSLEHKRFHVVAHDWGGILGWQLAADFPERVKSLVIMNAPHPLIYERLYDSDPEQQHMAQYIKFLVAEGSEEPLKENDFKMLREAFGKSAPLNFTDDDWAGYRKAWSRGLKGPINYYRANIGKLALDKAKLGSITTRTLVLWGEKDTAISLKNLDGLASLVPHIKIKRYSHAGHFINHEMTQIMISEIRAFFKEQEDHETN
jgi:pimeloyl-ACP methyl ester carboxylesterase